jgi:hypothetical protein
MEAQLVTDPAEVAPCVCSDFHLLQQKYIELTQNFVEVCSKYNIRQCYNCNRYRKNLVSCLCGRAYCKKCDCTYKNRREVTLLPCDKCRILTCANCSLDHCAVCDLNVCRRADCLAYVCDGSRYNGCTNIICCDSQCKKCLQLFCRSCMPEHRPCRPKLCSCGQLVHAVPVGIVPARVELAHTQINPPQTHAAGTYSIIYCGICGISSCDDCSRKGLIHRARHSIIPFIIITTREEFPHDLPLEIIQHIWFFLISK